MTAISSAQSTGHAQSGGGGNSSSVTVHHGDTLISIAARNGVSLQSLIAANPQILNPSVIYPGDNVTIPSGGGSGQAGGAQGVTGFGDGESSSGQGRLNEAMRFFERQGWSHAQAAGIVGNLQAESGIDPHRAQNGGGPGYGLAQWEAPRQADFAAWAGHDIHQSSFQEQLKFIQHELTTTESAAGKSLKETKTASEAAQVFCNECERPGVPHMKNRIDAAQAAFNGSSPTSKPGPDGSDAARPHNGGNTASKAPASGGDHIVRSGDTLWDIARSRGVSLSALIAANPQIANPDLIFPGQTVHIPGSSSSGSHGTNGAHGTNGSNGTNAPTPTNINGVHGNQRLADAARAAAMGMGGYTGQNLCATGVSRAIQNGLGISVSGNGNQIDNNLPRDKFKQIDIPLSEALKIPGLVLTWESTSSAAGSIYGHTAITLGDGQSSASDFIETNTLAREGGRSQLKIFMPV